MTASRFDAWNDRWDERWGRSARVTRVVVVILMLLVSAFSVGDTFGLFSAGPGGGTNSFTAGSLTLNEDVSGVCAAGTGNVAPGDSGSCTMTTTYAGTVAAYVALDIIVQTKAGVGGTALYTPSDATQSLAFTVADNQGAPVSYSIPTSTTTCAASGAHQAAVGSVCYELDNLLVRTTPLSTGTTMIFTTSWSLPTAAGNLYQGGTAKIILVSHAVQSSHNTLACTTTPTVGQACSPGTGFTWT
jgi:hypothetical protein